jgi:hypothetical protein
MIWDAANARDDSLQTGFTDPNPGSSEILPQARIMFRQSPQLELSHRLLVWACGDHVGRLCGWL